MKNAAFSRTERIGDQIQRELAQVLQFEMKDPRLGLITLNAVRVSRDLAWADVYFTSLDGSQAQAGELEQVLAHAGGFLRSTLARRMMLRAVPRLRFHYDRSVEDGLYMDKLIERARDDDDARTDQDEGDRS